MFLNRLLHLPFAPMIGAQIEFVLLDVLYKVRLIAETHLVVLHCRVLLAELQLWGVGILRVGVRLLFNNASPKLCYTTHSNLLVTVFLVLTISFDFFHCPPPPEPCTLRLCCTLPWLNRMHILNHVQHHLLRAVGHDLLVFH